MVLKKENLILKIFIFLLFLIQINYVLKIGASYDIAGLRYGAGLSIRRGLNFLNLKNYYLPELNESEYFGMIFLIPSYLFGHTVNIFFGNRLIETEFFITNDNVIYTFMFIFFNIYLFLCFYYLSVYFKKIFSLKFSLTFIILIFLYPTYIGQAMFNIKDISFSIQLFITSLAFVSFVNNLKNINYENSKINNNIIYLSILYSSVLLIRLNGIAFLSLLSLFGLIKCIKQKDKIKFYVLTNIKIYLVSIFSVIFFSPSSWENPIKWFNETLNHQFFHKFPSTTITNGIFVDAQDVTRTYLIEWLFYRSPVIYIVLIFITIFFKSINNNFSEFYKFSLFFIICVNFAFFTFQPTAYDGMRQYLFLLPFIVFICTENLLKLENKFKTKYFLTLFSIFYLVITQFSLGQYKYIYFNEFVKENRISEECKVKNIDGCGMWFSDYLGISGKALIKNFLDFAPENSNLLVCRPEHVFEKFLSNDKAKINLFRSDRIIDHKIFYTATLHRPRNDGDSCNFIFLENKPKCKIIYQETVMLRKIDINLSYINLCNF